MSFQIRNLLQAGVATLVLGAVALSAGAASAEPHLKLDVRPGHDVVINQPGNKTIHVWSGKGGYFVTNRDYNAGTAVTVFYGAGQAPVVMPPVTVRPAVSEARAFDRDTGDTTIRTIPVGGKSTDRVVAGNRLRD